MKLIVKVIFLLTIVNFSIIHCINEVEISSARPWCWTKPALSDPSFILNEANGGINWGYCKLGSVSNIKKKEIYVYIASSQLPDSGTTSKISIQLIGKEDVSEELVISETGLKAGSYEKVKLFTKDVGNLQSIKLITSGTSNYRCDSIKIESEMEAWNFECEESIKCPKCSTQLFVVSLVDYEITLKTSSLDNSGTTVPIYIQLWGTDAIAPKKLLSDKGFETGTTETLVIRTMNVGNLYAVSITIIGFNEFLPEEIIVKYDSQNGRQERMFKNTENEIIDSSDKTLMLKLPKPNSKDNESEYEKANKNFNSVLSSKDKLKVIKISCVDVLKDNQNFGPKYVTNVVNYSMFLVECPSNCTKIKNRVYGLGIHPEESPICISAIIDRSMSLYGGIIGINVISGIQSYTGGKKIFGFQIESYGVSKRSFTITKVDNIDLINKDVRILDFNGNPSYKGRVEIRNDGVWGTICNQNLDQKSAQVICKQVGYRDGTFLGTTKEESNGFCSNYEGMDYCGSNVSRISFSNLNCQGNEIDIFDCYRQIADPVNCNHKYDAIIECINTVIDDEIRFSPGTTRLIDFTGNPTQTGIGRLEVLTDTWGTICNKNFDNNAAMVSCKQMGYSGGKIFGIQDSQNMCGNVLGSNICGDFNQKIKYTDVFCRGNETTLTDCSISDITVSCTHFNDVVLKCDGIGDSSGKSQNIRKPKILNPLIEKLPMPPSINAKCNTTLKEKQFRGDPGSIFLVNCPVNCLLDKSSVTGTGIYSIDSSICRSAIHSGVINNEEGGNVLVSKTYGQNKFFSSILRKVASLESQYLKVGFFISMPTSAHINLVSDFSNSPVVENTQSSFLELTNQFIYSSKDNFLLGTIPFLKVNIKKRLDAYSWINKRTILKDVNNNIIHSNSIHKPDSFIEISSNSCEIVNNNSCLKSYEYNNFSSFIEVETKTAKPAKAIFEWTTPNQEFAFKGSNGVDLITIEESKKLFDLKTFTIILKFSMQHFVEKTSQTLFSLGGCDGYSIVIDQNSELIFDLKCGTNIFKSNIFIPLNSNITVYIAYDGNTISFYYNGDKFDSQSTYFNFHFKKKIAIGKSSEYDNDYFIGKFFFITFFDESFGSQRIQKIHEVGYEKPDPIRKMKFITHDQRLCISSCVNQAIPGTPGEPIPPKEATTYDISGVTNNLAGESKGIIDEKLGITSALQPLVEITCNKTMREFLKTEMKPGIKRRVKCPKDCYKKKGPIFGTFVYTIDSSICLSGIHAGIIKGLDESVIEVLTSPPLTYYQGSKQFNFVSASIDKAELSFTVQEATSVIKVDCKTPASDSNFSGTIGMMFIVNCPSDCSKIPSSVFGGKPPSKFKQLGMYSGDSSICQAAIHAGVTNDRGGEVQFSILEGAKLYYGSKSYGIESKPRDFYVKSISFFSSDSPLSVSFKEEFKSELITENWEIIDNLEAENFPSKWEYVSSKGLNTGANKNQKFVIKQSSKIRADSKENNLNFGSNLLLKNVDVVNILFKASFYFVNLSPVGMIFRYKDENNYYHLRINENSVGSYKVVLVKKFEGKDTIIATKDMTIVPRIWYSFNIYQYFERIKITTRIGDLKNTLTIMEVLDNDLQRGRVGLATNGNDNFYVGVVFIEPYELDSPINKLSINSGRTFEIILKENTKLHREKYCKSKFTDEYTKSLECREFHNYCKMVCDQEVHRREQVLNFMCYNKCVKDAILKYKLNNLQQDSLALGIDNGIWTPKEGEKCDFKPDDEGNTFWTPCFIKQVKNNAADPEQKFVQIKYMVNGSERTGNILYPNITLKKCGQILNIRKDCDSLSIDVPNLEKDLGGIK